MRIPLVVAHVRMLPRLDAEEAIAASTRVQVGTGSIKKSDAQEIQAGWRAAASAGRPRKKLTAGTHAGLARAAGIRVVRRAPGGG